MSTYRFKANHSKYSMGIMFLLGSIIAFACLVITLYFNYGGINLLHIGMIMILCVQLYTGLALIGHRYFDYVRFDGEVVSIYRNAFRRRYVISAIDIREVRYSAQKIIIIGRFEEEMEILGNQLGILDYERLSEQMKTSFSDLSLHAK